MSIKFQGINIQGPFSKIVGWEYPLGEGFMFKPIDKENPDGWGKPFEDTQYGTPGGKHERKHLYWSKKKEKWKWAKEPGDQVYGNIDWIGPFRKDKKGERSGTEEKNHERISYYGPPARYFASEPDDFNYGSGPEHEEIYYQGRYLAIAPKPVLGACLRIEEIPVLDSEGRPVIDPDTNQPKVEDDIWIIAICKDNDGDIMYRRRWPASTVRADGMDSITRASFKETKSEENPTGWETLTIFSKQTNAYAADTPWFFNESGTQAKAMRRFEDEFDNGSVTVKEDAQYIYTCDMTSIDSASIVNEGVWGTRFDFKVASTKRHPPLYTDLGNKIAPDGQPYAHEWQEDDLEMDVTLDGTVTLCHDYVGDVLMTATLTAYGYRGHYQYWTEGADDPLMEDSQGNNISNDGNLNGPVYDQPDPYVPEPDNHFPDAWFSAKHYYLMEWDHPLDGPQRFSFGLDISGSWSDYETGWEEEGDPNDTNIYIFGGYNRWLHFMDMRHKIAVYHEREYNFFYKSDEETFYKRENLQMRSADEDPDTYEDNQITFTDDTETTGIFKSFWYTRTRMEAWEKDEELLEEYSRTSWTGEWSTDNEDSSIIEPSERDFNLIGTTDITRSIDYWPDYDDWEYLRWLQWPDYFKKHNFEEGGYGVDNEENMFLSLIVEDLTSGGQKKVNLFVSEADIEASEGRLEEIVPFGDQYFPIGVY